ncbi:dephospho-CoA kinase [SAR202 cluster bacterium AD-802-E10_MRT_200m]|nr:dephospho-CoA kinase [SAR202 cluster bacterium AD-802-E10_MRT_200m]
MSSENNRIGISNLTIAIFVGLTGATLTLYQRRFKVEATNKVITLEVSVFVIGLTGGIGTGKSLVSQFLQGLGAGLIDADKLGHQAYRPHSTAWDQVVAAFGTQITLPDEEIDRKKLGSIVFADTSKLDLLNAIMHPKIAEMAKVEIDNLKTQNFPVAVLEAAVLIEANWMSLVDEVWVTIAPEELVVQRIQIRNKLSEEAIRSRVKSQLPQEERIAYAHVVINNDKDEHALREQIKLLWETRIEEKVKINGQY